MRKLALTSILGLIAPGSAGQVVVGLLLAFVALMANLRLKPYADDGLNFVSQTSQLNLFFFLFVALLLKVNLDGQGDAHFFGVIVGVLSLVRPRCVPRAQRCGWLTARATLAAGAHRAAPRHQAVDAAVWRRPRRQHGARLQRDARAALPSCRSALAAARPYIPPLTDALPPPPSPLCCCQIVKDASW